MKRFKALWQSLWGDADRRVRLGRVLGLGFIVVGFVFIGKAWDGAANHVRVDSQFPYLLSGGFMGLGMIVTGATLLFLSTVRSERQLMTDKFDEVATLLARNLSRLQFSSNGRGSTNGKVIAAATAYHRAECRVLEGKQGLTEVSIEEAQAEGLVPCRVCNPPLPEKESEEVSAGSGKPTP